MVNILNNLDDVKKLYDKENEIILLKYGASWCQPCKQLDKIMELVSELIPKISFNSINIDGMESDLEISSVPTVLIIKDGKEIDRFSGVKLNLKSYLDSFV